MDKNAYRWGIFIAIFVLFGVGFGKDQPQNELVFKGTENAVVVWLPASPGTLHPVLSADLYSRVVLEEFFQCLLRYDPQTLGLQPLLVTALSEATSYTSGLYSGSIGYTVEPREEAEWNNGTPSRPKDRSLVRGYGEYDKNIEVDPGNSSRFTVLPESESSFTTFFKQRRAPWATATLNSYNKIT